LIESEGDKVNVIRLSGLMVVMFVLSACSAESIKRTGYETVQNIGDRQCQKDFTTECPERPSYEAYKKDTGSLERSD
jgi:hypothetical protein